MKKFKKIIALCLAAMAAVSAMSVSASAEDISPFDDDATIIYMDIADRPAFTDDDGNVIEPQKIHDDDYDITPYVTIYESEPNNTRARANQTYSDYYNEGKIGYAGDIDYWKVNFTNAGEGVGVANFWVGNIPSNCDYRLTIYENIGNGTYRAFPVDNHSDYHDEVVEGFQVATDRTYYIAIDSKNNSYSTTKSYQMRVRQL